jgi:hypothetical protein
MRWMFPRTRWGFYCLFSVFINLLNAECLRNLALYVICREMHLIFNSRPVIMKECYNLPGPMPDCSRFAGLSKKGNKIFTFFCCVASYFSVPSVGYFTRYCQSTGTYDGLLNGN